MELKEGYKITEIGIVPKDWDVVTTESISDVKSGKRLPLGNSLSSKVTPYPYIRISDMLPGTIDLKDIRYIPNHVYPAIKNYRIFKSDIFISVAGTLGLVGKIPDKLDGANLTENADRLTNIKINRDYLMYVFMSPLIQRFIELERTLGAQPKLALIRIRNFKVPLPPSKKEQTAIANALSDADAWIQSLTQLIAKKRQIKQGVMQTLLNPYKNGLLKKGWKERPLHTMSYMKGRIGWQGLNQTEFTMNIEEPFLVTGMNFKDGDIRWEEVYHISYERYEIAKEIQLKKDDVLMTKDGTIGKLLYINDIPYPGKATLNSHLLVFRPIKNSYCPKFLYYQLSSKLFKNYIEISKSGSTFFGLSQEAVGNYLFKFPQIEEQISIANTLSDIDTEIRDLEAKLIKTKQIKQGMMQNLLTGRIRLI